MKVLATSYADSCERKKAQYTQTHLEILKRNVLYQLMKHTKERENTHITRKLEKPSTKPMNTQIPYKILLNKIINQLSFSFLFFSCCIYALSDLLVT
jgi:hypothetical protein